MFENLRRSLDDLLQRATKPEDRRLALAHMKGTLVQARLGVDDLREGLEKTRRALEGEKRELETVRRRKGLAESIKDAETVTIAERFELKHAERVRVLEEKVTVQARELELAERELEAMKAELRNALSGIPGAQAREPLEDPLADDTETRMREELDAMARDRARSSREMDAEKRLEELKRRMGK